MAMSIGSCAFSIDSNGRVSFTGSGLALALLQGRVNVIIQVTAALVGWTPTIWKGLNDGSATIAAYALADATAIVQHLQANAVAHVTNQSLGLTPSPNNANTAIQPPASPVDVPIQ